MSTNNTSEHNPFVAFFGEPTNNIIIPEPYIYKDSEYKQSRNKYVHCIELPIKFNIDAIEKKIIRVCDIIGTSCIKSRSIMCFTSSRTFFTDQYVDGRSFSKSELFCVDIQVTQREDNGYNLYVVRNRGDLLFCKKLIMELEHIFGFFDIPILKTLPPPSIAPVIGSVSSSILGTVAVAGAVSSTHFTKEGTNVVYPISKLSFDELQNDF